MSRKDLLKLQDKIDYLPLFSKMMKQPHDVLSKSTLYKLHPDDFVEQFHKVLYATINNLYISGVVAITPIEINAYLNNYTVFYRIYKDNNGDEYIERALKLEESENFEYHYNRIKKFSLLRHYVQQGIDITDIYNVNVIDMKEEEQQSDRFNSMSVSDIIKHFDVKMIDIKSKFAINKEGGGGKFSDDIENIFANLLKAKNFGYNMSSGYLNTVTRGARLRKLYCISGNSGSGKTRSALGHLLNMTVPEMWVKDKWVKTNNIAKGLFISTELEDVEFKVPAICFIADVEEDKVQNNKLSEDEIERLKYAMKVLKETPIWYEELFDFDTEDIEHEIEKHVYKNEITVCCFDYLHSTLKMFDSMAKKGARNLAEHQALRIMSIKLKNLCNRYNIHILTATQLNESWKYGALDQSALEGSKSIVNKLDIGAIQLTLSAQDEAIWQKIKMNSTFGQYGDLEPTHTINVYKNRGNKWKLVRVWVYFNLGTCRMVDLFVTNYKGELIKDIEPIFVEFESEDDVVVEYDEIELVTPAEEIEQIIQDSNEIDDEEDFNGWFNEQEGE